MPHDPRPLFDLAGHSNVPSLRRGVYISAHRPEGISLADWESLALLVEGYDNPQIAAIRGVVEHTVKDAMTRLMDALGARSRSNLAYEVLRRRIVIIEEG